MKAHEEKEATVDSSKKVEEGAIPAYLLDRNEVNRTKVLSNMIKQKRKEKAGKWKVPIEKVKAMAEDEADRHYGGDDCTTVIYSARGERGFAGARKRRR